MKAKEISAILLLAALLVGSALSSRKAADLADNMTKLVEDTLIFAQANQSTAAAANAKEAADLWQRNSMFSKILLHHSDVDTIDMVLAEFECAVKTDNMHEILAKGNLLCDRLSELKQLETLSFTSLL